MKAVNQETGEEIPQEPRGSKEKSDAPAAE
jgi:hypothetical protein